VNSLDRLAYSAADAIEGSVSHIAVPVWGKVASPFADVRRTLGYALAGATAAVLAVVALLVVAPPGEESTDFTPSTVAVTTVPSVPSTVDVTIPTTTPLNPDRLIPVPIPDLQDRPVQADIEPPELVIVSPADGEHVITGRVVVEGYTEIGAGLASSGGERIDVDHEGHWSHVVSLALGENSVGYVAIDGAGNETRLAIVIVRDAPPTTTTTQPRPKDTTTTTKARTWEFTAHSTYGTCAEDPPYDAYYGRGKPGTEITVSSEFGGGSTMVGHNGEWEIKVFFPSAPFDRKFDVKVKDFTGAKKTFSFVRTFD
jgi:hypothetical protein